jgi:hypothetical protein
MMETVSSRCGSRSVIRRRFPPHDRCGARRRKVCFALPSLAGGGAERTAVQILNAVDGERWERSLYLFAREGPYLAEVSPSIHIAGGGGGSSRIGRLLALRRFIRDVRPDVVVAFLSYFSVLCAVRAAGVGARVVFDQGTPLSEFLRDADFRWSRPLARRVFAAATRFGYAAADLVVTTSRRRGRPGEVLRRQARTRPGGAQPVDLDGIAAAASQPIDPAHAALWRPPVIVAAGRLADVKNYPCSSKRSASSGSGRLPSCSSSARAIRNRRCAS